MTATTTSFDQKARGDVSTSYAAAPASTITVNGVDFAYRELGPATGVPVIFLTHLAAVLDNWDPRVVDGIAAAAPGHRLRQPGCRRLGRLHARHHRGDGARRRRVHPGPRARAGRPPRLLDGRHDRPGDRRATNRSSSARSSSPAPALPAARASRR